MLIIIVGTPFSGKKTLAQRLVKDEGFVRVEVSAPGRSEDTSFEVSTVSASPISVPPSVSGKSRDIDDTAEDSRGLSSLRSGAPHTIATPSALLDYVTHHWRANIVTTTLTSATDIDMFKKRPFVTVVYTDAPVAERFARSGMNDLSAFVTLTDAAQFTGPEPSSALQARADHIVHTSDALSLERLASALRPSWDTYFMLLASLASMRSNCMKRRVGAVIVRNSRVISTGYNGTPRFVTNCNEGGCMRCNNLSTGYLDTPKPETVPKDLEQLCICLHAEENALLEAGRERVQGIDNKTILYCNTCPCLKCAVKIIQAGISEVVYSLSYSMDGHTQKVMAEAGVTLRQMELPAFPR